MVTSKLFLILCLFLEIFILLFLHRFFFNSFNLPISIKNDTEKFQKYINLHNFLSKNTETNKVVVFLPQKAGYGNLIYGVISSLVIAILTDSFLFVRWPEVENYISTPLNEIFNEPKFLKLDNFTIVEAFSSNDWIFEKKFKYIVNEKFLLEKRGYIYKDIRPFFFNLCSKEINFEKLLNYGLVEAKTVDLAKKAIRDKKMNEMLRIDLLYSIGFEVGSFLLTKIWKISPEIQYYVDKIYREHFINNFVIGMQFRFEYISEKDVSKFIECSLHISKKFIAPKVKWFISSDDEKVFTLLKNYSQLIIKSYGKIGHIVHDKSNYFRTILDNELLSKSNKIIISGGSTFGFVSALRKHELPYYVEAIGLSNVMKTPCSIMKFHKAPRTNTGLTLI